MSTLPQLAVVVGRAPGSPSAQRCLAALAEACGSISLQLLVPEGVEHSAGAQTFSCPEGALVPEQWGMGAEQARAPLVGFLTTELAVRPEWARTLLPLLTGEVVGAAGAIDAPRKTGGTAGAAYLARFSAFLPAPGRPLERVRDLPGDGAIYRRDAIAAHPDLLREGFFEVEFHRRFLSEGKALVLCREPLVEVDAATSLTDLARLRFRHAFGHGAARVQKHHHPRLRIAALSPFVPLVLMGRIARRAGLRRAGEVARALVPLGVLSAAWASGEALGAMTAQPDRRRR